MEAPTFTTKDQEIKYWKQLAHQYHKEKQDSQQDLDDFQEESRQLEIELEASLNQAERISQDLRNSNHKLQAEVESIQIKLEMCQKDYYTMDSQLRDVTSEKERLVVYIRDLEQKNDDLERAHRVVTESVASFEDMLNKAYERNAMLESEVGEKENLQVQLQRLRDETRDLKQELCIKDHRLPDNDKSLLNGHTNSFNSTVDSNRLHSEMETQTSYQQGQVPLKRDPSLNGNTLTPAGRISAMNIVGDLLRKVGFGKLLCSACNKVTCTCSSPPTPQVPNAATKTGGGATVLNVSNALNKQNKTREMYDNQNLTAKELTLINTVHTEINDQSQNGIIRNGARKNSITRPKSSLNYSGSLRVFNRQASATEQTNNVEYANKESRLQTWFNNLVTPKPLND